MVDVAELIQQSPQPSTLNAYDRHWWNFVLWCQDRNLSSSSCAPPAVLKFLLDGFSLIWLFLPSVDSGLLL